MRKGSVFYKPFPNQVTAVLPQTRKEYVMNITKSTLGALAFNGRETTYFDDTLKGFGVRVGKASASYIVMYRNAYGKQKKLTIAKTTQITPAQARDEAKRILALVVQGKDPASDKIEKRKEITVSDLARMFLADRKPRVKLNTYQRYCQSVEYQINPALGDRYVKELKRSDVQQFYNKMIEGKFMHRNYKRQAEHKYVSGANIVRKTLHAMFEFAIVGEIVAVNPCDRLQTLSTPKRTAFIDEKGYVKLGECLASCTDKTAADMTRLLALTGCRKGEIASLKWAYVDWDKQVFHFPDTKTGAQDRPFGSAAKRFMEKLKEKKQPPSADEYVFGKPQKMALVAFFEKHIKAAVGQAEFCPHALRHSFATMAAETGYSDNIIAGMLGHSINSITHRYTHLSLKSVIQAANIVSEKIAELMGI